MKRTRPGTSDCVGGEVCTHAPIRHERRRSRRIAIHVVATGSQLRARTKYPQMGSVGSGCSSNRISRLRSMVSSVRMVGKHRPGSSSASMPVGAAARNHDDAAEPDYQTYQSRTHDGAEANHQSDQSRAQDCRKFHVAGGQTGSGSGRVVGTAGPGRPGEAESVDLSGHELASGRQVAPRDPGSASR